VKRKYHFAEPILAKSHDGSRFELQRGDYYADTGVDGDWVAVYIDLRPTAVSRVDFARVARLINP
jgi:hypothetical protein